MITSRQNPAIKEIRGLRQRDERARTGLAFIDGTRSVAEAIQTGVAVERLVATPSRVRGAFAQGLVADAVARGVPYLEVSEEVFDSLCDSEGRQGLGAVVYQRWTPLEEARCEGSRTWVAMNAVQYPGNLGTIMRTLDSVGGAGIILLGSGTDPYHPAAVRASTGAIFNLQLVQTDLPRFARWKQRWGARVVAADVAGTASYRETAYTAPTILLMGAERDGLTEEQRALCDLLVRIPMIGRSDSLNLAVAASVILYEIFHQTARHQTNGG